MPKISGENSYGSGDQQDQRLSFRERLVKRFASHEWVRVVNIDDERFKWQYLPSNAEEFSFTPDPMKITRRGEVEVYALDPGESEVLIGENAYLMIEGLYKKLISKKVVADHPDATAPLNFNWNDGIKQEQFIDKIYLGKEKLTFKTTKIDTPVLTDKERNLARRSVIHDENKVPINDMPGRMRRT
jgi:hypothetical protein